jgi:hypothetical protein
MEPARSIGSGILKKLDYCHPNFWIEAEKTTIPRPHGTRAESILTLILRRSQDRENLVALLLLNPRDVMIARTQMLEPLAGARLHAHAHMSSP